jgi:hypothetical protein
MPVNAVNRINREMNHLRKPTASPNAAAQFFTADLAAPEFADLYEELSFIFTHVT